MNRIAFKNDCCVSSTLMHTRPVLACASLNGLRLEKWQRCTECQQKKMSQWMVMAVMGGNDQRWQLNLHIFNDVD